MGRSGSCFKIITCGGDSADKDDVQVSENKGSTDKRGWSFRKRSARHRVLSNTVISETPSSANKESPEPTTLNLQEPVTSNVLEKISVIQCTDEKPLLSTSADSKISESIVVAKDEREADAHVDESVIVIQAAIRGLLAQRELHRLKNVIKLQAAVRGHLVRQHAVGTLRCVQAIVKMQALVRARLARSLLEGSSVEKKSDGKHNKTVSKTSEKENSVTKPTVTYPSMEKLLSNRFACQLMESRPRNRPIRIKCDPAKPNSAWNWLERWMSVSSAEPKPNTELVNEKPERKKNEKFAPPVETRVPSESYCESADSNSNAKEVLPSESEENLIIYEADNLKSQASKSTSYSVRDDLEQHKPEKSGTSDAKENLVDINSVLNQNMQSDVDSEIVVNPLPCEPEIKSEQPDQPKRSMKRLASELETEGKKFAFGSRKASNPTCIAAQSKFEDLSSTPNASISSGALYQDVGVEINMDSVSSGADTVAGSKGADTVAGSKRADTVAGSNGADTVTGSKELKMAENLVSHDLRVQYGDSECGTELSITSTLDSPDVYDIGAAGPEHEVKVPEEETCNPSSTKGLDTEVIDASTDTVPNLSNSLIDQPEKLGGVLGESVNSIVATDSPVDLNPDRSASDVKRERDSETGGPAYRSSPETSPRSHVTVPESQGTPSSQLSVKAKKNRTDKSGSNLKRKSVSAGKRSPSYPDHDSGARSSVERLPRDQKNGKRRNSFGSTRPEPTDQEPRDSSSSSNSLPHFMQATESARAKIQANNSPRSSPDVQDRDYIKKRHSLPGANGRQISPRILRSTSQAQQGTKGNDSHVVHDKKWQR